MSETIRKSNAREARRAELLALAITASCSAALSGGVIASLIYLLLALASLMAVPPAFAQTAPVSAGVRLEAGIEKEDVDGDLTSAMDIYQKIAADKSAPRDVRAKALLRLAGCDEKLGHQARQVYEQIVHDYSDLPAAAQARRRLALIQQQEHPAPPPTMSIRKIEWAGPGLVSCYDTDGESATFMAPDGNLYFGDLAGHSKRLIFKGEPDSPNRVNWQASRDFSMVALNLPAKPGRPATVAVVRTDGTGYRELAGGSAKGNILAGNIIFWMYWSWDNHNLLLPVYFGPKEPSRLWVVSTADGQHRELVRTEGYIGKAAFSPDGRYVAYEVAPGEATSVEKSRIFVVPAQGGEPRLVYDSGPWAQDARFGVLKDWTADGQFLAIKDVRQGKSSLYLLPMKNGVATGPAEFVRYGDYEVANMLASGALAYSESSSKPGRQSAFLASLNSAGRLGSWKQLDLRGRLDEVSNASPSFSPDGSQIAYVAGDVDPAREDIVLRTLATGQERVLLQSTNKNLRCQFSAHNPRIFCTHRVDDKGEEKTELISVAADSGSVEQIASFPGSMIILQSSIDDETFYFSAAANHLPGLPPIVRWDRSTHRETVVSALSEGPRIEAPSLDGRWLVRMLDGSLQARPMSGGDWKSLVSGVTEMRPPETTADGEWILYHAVDSAGKPSLFRVSVNGGDPQLLGDYPFHQPYGDALRTSPDNSKILALDSVDTSFETWILQNFEPPPKK